VALAGGGKAPSLTSAAKADSENEPVIAAVNRCATQNLNQLSSAVNYSTPSREDLANGDPTLFHPKSTAAGGGRPRHTESNAT